MSRKQFTTEKIIAMSQAVKVAMVQAIKVAEIFR